MLHITEWTPKGDKLRNVNHAEYKQAVVDSLKALVRETAYHVCQLEATKHSRDEEWSRSACLYQQACDALVKFAGRDEAEKFFAATYKPLTLHRHSEPRLLRVESARIGGGSHETLSDTRYRTSDDGYLSNTERHRLPWIPVCSGIPLNGAGRIRPAVHGVLA